MSEMVSRIIDSCHGRDKVIDFRDQLFKAKDENYASLYEGGIGVYLCDYTKGTGERSTSVHAQIDPVKFEEFKVIAEKNLGTISLPFSIAPSGEKTGLFGDLSFYIFSLKRIVLSMKGFMEELVNAGLTKEGVYKALVRSHKELSSEVISSPLSQSYSFDYGYKQERVNSYKDLGDGFYPVSSLEVYRHGYRDGKRTLYPWFIRITTFEAKKVEGSITYDPSTIRRQRQAYINVSDEDMLRVSIKVLQFRDMFLLANSIKPVKDSYERRKNGGKAA